MTTYNHTDITFNDYADTAVVNAPLGQLDAAIGNVAALTTTADTDTVVAINELDANIGDLALLGTTTQTSIVAAIGSAALRTDYKLKLIPAINELLDRVVAAQSELDTAASPYETLVERLNAFVVAGGNIATKTNGVSAAGQKVVTVDSTTGFIVGSYVVYYLNGTTLEGNVIASIQAGISLTMVSNVGATPAGGVLDDTPISMISISEYLAAQAIPHSGSLMLPQTIAAVNGNRFNVKEAYGAKGDGSTDDTTAVQEAVDAMLAAPNGGTVFFPAGVYVLTHLDLHSDSIVTGNREFRLSGDGQMGTVLTFETTGVAVDCTGRSKVMLENMMITSGALHPSVGLLLARSTVSDQCAYGRFTNLTVWGNFTQASVASVASEGNVWIGCVFNNTNTTEGGAVFYSGSSATGYKVDETGAWETFTVASSHGTIKTNSNYYGNFYACEFVQFGVANILLSIDSAATFTWNGCMFIGGDTDGKIPAQIVITTEQQYPLEGAIRFQDCYFEQDVTEVTHGIMFYNPQGTQRAFSHFSVRDCVFNFTNYTGLVPNQQSLTYEGSVSLTNLTYDGNSRSGARADGITVASLTNSSIRVDGTITCLAGAGYINCQLKAENYAFSGTGEIYGTGFATTTLYRDPVTVAPVSGLWFAGERVYHVDADIGHPVGWQNIGTGAAYGAIRENTHAYAVGTWLSIGGVIYEVTAGSGNTGGSPPSTAGAIGSTVADGGYTLTKRSDHYNAWLPFGQVGYREGSATPAGTLTPYYIGEEYLDSSAFKWYKATGTANTDWAALN